MARGKTEAIMGIADAVKPSSVNAIRSLQRMALEVVMLTGDNQRTANVIAREVGIERIFAEVRPDQKVATIERIQAEGKIVAMWATALTTRLLGERKKVWETLKTR